MDQPTMPEPFETSAIRVALEKAADIFAHRHRKRLGIARTSALEARFDHVSSTSVR